MKKIIPLTLFFLLFASLSALQPCSAHEEGSDQDHEEDKATKTKTKSAEDQRPREDNVIIDGDLLLDDTKYLNQGM